MTPTPDPGTRTPPHGDPLAGEALPWLADPIGYMIGRAQAEREAWLDDLEQRDGKGMRDVVESTLERVERRMTDELLYGASYQDAEGNRIDPRVVFDTSPVLGRSPLENLAGAIASQDEDNRRDLEALLGHRNRAGDLACPRCDSDTCPGRAGELDACTATIEPAPCSTHGARWPCPLCR